jgi:head-tail adaptor
MQRFLFGLAGLGILFLAASLSAAGDPQRGRGAPPPPPQNLQLYPADIEFQQLITTMQGFAKALGVDCGHCHVWEGNGNPNNDMASDAKPTKNTARMMIRMAREVNAKLRAESGKPEAEVTAVRCATCHRGAAIPVVEE